jgi:carbon-monoxide dehydrogenase medium subunit
MKPPKFRYFAPQSIEEALALLVEHADEARVLAGGQSLVPLMNMRLAHPGVLVDINGISELAYVRPWDGGLALGAMTRDLRARHHCSSPSAASRRSRSLCWTSCHPQP